MSLDFQIDPGRFELVCGLRRVSVHGVPWRILQWFAEHPRRTLQRDFALREFHGSQVSTRALDSAIKLVRQKLAEVGSQARVEAITKVGYRMTCAADYQATQSAWVRVLAVAERQCPQEVALLRLHFPG